MFSIADARIEPCIADVDQQVSEEDRDGNEHDHRLEQRVMSLVDRLDKQPPSPRKTEDLFDNDCSGHEIRHLGAQDRDHGNHRQLQRVAKDNDAAAVRKFHGEGIAARAAANTLWSEPSKDVCPPIDSIR